MEPSGLSAQSIHRARSGHSMDANANSGDSGHENEDNSQERKEEEGKKGGREKKKKLGWVREGKMRD